MTSIGMLHPAPLATPDRGRSLAQRLLLLSGVLSSALYIVTDLLSAARYPGYSIRDQAVSELAAIGAPTADLWSTLMPAYGVLLVAFGVGVVRAQRENHVLRATGALLVGFAVIGTLWRFFPMHQRGTAFSWTDIGHIVLAGVTVLLIVVFVAVGAFALGRAFRVYSLLTIAAELGAGIATFSWANRVSTNVPTPWLGAVERVNVYGYLVWVAVLATLLLRRGLEGAPRRKAPAARTGAFRGSPDVYGTGE